jgi:plastocyanin
VARRLVSTVLLSVVGLGLAAASGLAVEPAIEATGSSLATYAWTPSTAAVDSGGSVTFKNPTANPHGLAWESGPETPGCTGTSNVGAANWSGSCTFAQGGTYRFYCPVHPTLMKGTVSVSGPAAPEVNTGSASAVSGSEATLNGTVNPSEQETSYFFEYGTTAAYGQKTPAASAGSGTSPVSKSATVIGLSIATTYHFRLVAENGTGTSFGTDRTFVTSGPPSTTTGPATGVGKAEATLTGSVNPHGFETVYFFAYGTTTAYGQKTVEVSAGAGVTALPAANSVTGLAPSTTYHFQLVAENTAGTTAGSDQMFTTAAVPPLESPPVIAQATPGAIPTPPPPAPATAPGTKLTLKPRAKTSDRTPTVKFTATVPGATFKCSVDSRPLKPCRSPYTTPALKPGRHSIEVTAVADGKTDPTPARSSFKVVAKKK